MPPELKIKSPISSQNLSMRSFSKLIVNKSMDGKSNISKRGSVGFHPFMLHCYFTCYIVTLRATLPFILRYVSHNLCLIILHFVVHTYRTFMTRITVCRIPYVITQHNITYVMSLLMTWHNITYVAHSLHA
jgi:hypothetical protein